MFDTYIVKEGDTIKSISSKSGISEDIIYQLNGYYNTLTPGTVLVIPKTSSKYFNYYTISKGDTLYQIAKKYNINPSLLAQINGLNENDYIYPNQTILVSKEGYKLYITEEGDTLNEVVKGLNADINKLLEQNNNIYLQKEQLIIYNYK